MSMPSSASRSSSAGVGGAPPVPMRTGRGSLDAPRIPDRHRQHRRRRAEMRDTGFAHVSPDRARIELRKAQVHAAGRRHRPREAPAVAMEHRQGPQVHGVAGQPHVNRHRERLQVRAAMVVHHALRPRGRAARVVDREHSALVGNRVQQRLAVGDQPFELVIRAARADEPQRFSDLRAGCRRCLGEFVVVYQHRRAGVLQDERHVGGRDPRIEGHQDTAGEWHGVVGGEHHVRIAREQRDAIAGLDPDGTQRAREAQAALQEFPVGEFDVSIDNAYPVGKHVRRSMEERGGGQRLVIELASHFRRLLNGQGPAMTGTAIGRKGQ